MRIPALVMLSSVLLPATSLAASVTVSPGDDIAALTSSLGPGDVITFSAGDYAIESQLVWSAPGEEGNPITFEAKGDVVFTYTGGGNIVVLRDSAHVTITGIHFTSTAENLEANDFSGLRIENSTYVSVQGCELDNIKNSAIVLAGDTSNITVRDNHIHDLVQGNGIYAGCGNASCWTQDTLIEGNLIHHLGAERTDGVEIDNGGQGNTIIDNVIYEVGGRGIMTKSTEGGAANTVERNVVWRAVEGGIRLTGSAIARNNIVFNVDGVGIESANERDALKDQVITHNTVYDTASYGVRLEGWAGKTGMVFANNAITNTTGRALRVDEDDFDDTNYISSNVVTGFVEGPLDTLSGHFTAGSGALDYLDPEAWEFYPSEASALRNNADATGEAWVPDIDFNGLPRDGEAPDVGAYEAVQALNPGWAIQEDFKELLDELPDNGQGVTGGGCCSDDTEPSEGAMFLLPLLGLGWVRRRKHA